MEKIAEVKDIPVGKALIVNDSEGREIALFNLEGEIYALENVCPHMGGPLGEGEIENHIVTCPWHAWTFDIPTGDCINMPGDNANSIPIVVKEGHVYVLDSPGL